MDIQIYEKTISVDKFEDSYIDKTFLEYCKDCNKYKANWACPPNDLDIEKFLEGYQKVDLYGQKISFSKDEIEESKGKDLSDLFRKNIYPLKTGFFKELLKKEDGGYLMASGYCNICSRCTRLDARACRYPHMLRMSMDSFGIDITRLAQEEFDVSMAWSTTSLPEYYFLISGILRKD